MDLKEAGGKTLVWTASVTYGTEFRIGDDYPGSKMDFEQLVGPDSEN